MCLWKRRQLEKVLLDSSGFSGLIYLRVLFFCYFPIVHFMFLFFISQKEFSYFFFEKEFSYLQKKNWFTTYKKGFASRN